MEENTKNNEVVDRLKELATPEGIQKYVFGFKKNGQPRAVYDIVKDYTKPKKKHKKNDKKKGAQSTFSFYLDSKGKKKKKDKKKHWHI